MSETPKQTPDPAGHPFREIADAMPHMVWLADPAGAALYHNRRILEYSGLTPAVTLGLGWGRLVHPDDTARVVAAWSRSVAAGEPFEAEYRLRRHDGVYQWFLVRAHPQRDDRGAIVRWVGTCTNVDDRKGEQARARAILENSFEAILLVSAGGAVAYSSLPSVRLLGRPVEEQLGRDVLALVHPDDVPAVRGVFGRLLAEPGGHAEAVFRGAHADGSQRWLEARFTNLLADPAVGAVVVNLHDVSDRVATEEAVRQSEARYRELFEANPHPMWVYDRETLRFLAVNDAATQRYGYSRDEFLDMRVTDIRPPDDVPALLEYAHDGADGLRPRGIWRHHWRDGTVRKVEVSAHSLPFAGRPARLVLALDVTDRLRAEAEARRYAELLRAVVDGTTDAVFVKDREGRYLLCNPAAARFLGRPADDVLGRDDAAMFAPESARRIRERDRRVMASGAGETAEEELTAGGVTRTFLVTKAPYRDEAGEVIGVVGISRDVTERNRLAAERDALLARLQLHVKRMPLAYVQFDAGMRVTDWNPAAQRTFGYTKAEAVGMGPPFERLVPASFCQEVEDILHRIRAGDMSANSMNENLTKDGRVITCEWFNTPLLDEHGRFTGLVCLVQDVTERVSLEGQLRQAQKMEAVGQLAGGIAHDFNNLLTVINGYSELLLQGLPPGDPSRELLGEIQKAGERAAGLTRQLLAFSRKQVLAPRLLDLNAVVGDTANMLRRMIGEDVRLAFEPGPALWPVKADPGQVEQVLMNLAVNARDAMPTGGRLTIETRNVEPGEDAARAFPDAPPGPYVVLAVSDTGAGMAPEVRARIFEPFFSTKGPGKGTGLGLAVVHGIVKQSGGHVAVRSEVGRGTTFQVYLPRAGAAGRAKGPSHNLAAPRGSETVLLVEDDSAVRALTSLVLHQGGYTVLEAADGNEALRVAAGHPGAIHLLVTDVVMPGLSGRELAERLADRHPGLRLLFVSGYTDDAVVRHGIASERVNFLHKPFSPAALAVKVREVLDAP